jgi:Na+/melibiose symporter-like transporter
MAVAARYLHIRKTVRRHSIDLLGALLLTVSVTTVLLASAWGGREYAWGSPQIIGLFVIGVVLAVAFLLQERRAREPILPLRLFRDRVFTVCVTLSALLGSVMIGASTFLPLFLQVVTGASATSSGLLLIPMMAGVVIGSNVCGRLVHRTGRYKAYPIIGIATALVGLVLLSTIEVATTRLFISVGMGIVGIGIGSSMPIMTLAVQNTAPAADMGAATSAVNFFRTLGGALGVAVFGTVMSARLDDTLEQLIPGTSLTTDDSLLSSPEAIRDLPLNQYAAVAEGIASGVAMVFLVALPLVVIAFTLAWLLKEVPLRDAPNPSVERLEGAGAV